MKLFLKDFLSGEGIVDMRDQTKFLHECILSKHRRCLFWVYVQAVRVVIKEGSRSEVKCIMGKEEGESGVKDKEY